MSKFKKGDQVKVKANAEALREYPQLINQVGSVYTIDPQGVAVEFDGSLIDGELYFQPNELKKVKTLPMSADAHVKSLRVKYKSQKGGTNYIIVRQDTL